MLGGATGRPNAHESIQHSQRQTSRKCAKAPLGAFESGTIRSVRLLVALVGLLRLDGFLGVLVIVIGELAFHAILECFC